MSAITFGSQSSHAYHPEINANPPPDDLNESHSPISCPSPRQVQVTIVRMNLPSNLPLCEAKPQLNQFDSSKGKSHI